MPNYGVTLKRTAHATQAVGAIQNPSSGTLRRLKIYMFQAGSEATPADNAFEWAIRRVTAPGVPAGQASVTPEPLNVADPAAVMAAAQGYTTNPTIASGNLLTAQVNQKATYRWEAVPGRELICAATASLGFAVLTPTMTAVTVTAHLHIEE